MNYNSLKKYLFDNRDPKFADFSKSLSNSEYISIGVKNPVLRELIKQHVNDEELRTEDFELGEYLEIDFIYFGLNLSRLKNVDDQLKFLKDKIKLAKSWAITDTMSTYIKKCTFEKYWDFYKSLYKSKYTYDRRMSHILGLKFYKDKRILEILKYLTLNEEYMVMMSEAWLLQTIAISYPDEIFNYLKDCNDITLKRKAISKINESFRFDENTKSKFKSLR